MHYIKNGKLTHTCRDWTGTTFQIFQNMHYLKIIFKISVITMTLAINISSYKFYIYPNCLFLFHPYKI